MSSSKNAEVGAYPCITVMLNGTASNLAEMILELTGLYPVNALLARALSKKPTPSCVVSSLLTR